VPSHGWIASHRGTNLEVIVNNIVSRWSKIPPTMRIACEHCGHDAERTEWQAQNTFHCYECGKDSHGLRPESNSIREEAQ